MYLYYVVSEHTVLGLCPAAPVPMVVMVLTPTLCPTYHSGTPYPVLGCGVDGSLDLGWMGGGGSVGTAH